MLSETPGLSAHAAERSLPMHRLVGGDINEAFLISSKAFATSRKSVHFALELANGSVLIIVLFRVHRHLRISIKDVSEITQRW